MYRLRVSNRPYATDVSGRNVFHYACASDKTENFKVLLEYVKNEGSDPDYEELTEARTIGGLTPIFSLED